MPPNAPLQIETFLPYMRNVVRCEAALHELNLMWRLIESSTKMNLPAGRAGDTAHHGRHP